MKFRKKPVVVEAIHYRGKQDDSLLKSFVDSHCLYRDGDTYKWLIATPEGDHQITDGDYIIKGVKGEFYPCKPDIFEMTYESAENGCCQNGKDHLVCLTIEEAKELATKLKNNADFFFLQTGEFDYDTDELWQCLTDKIEQAEIFQIGEDYNKALNRVAEEFQKQAEKGNETNGES